jgi:divalent metal cation (Fe/Co/Zn/Cd) transporter
LLTMHLAPKQILVNAHVNLKEHLSNKEIVETIADIERKIKEAEPKVDMIFLETAGLKETPDEKSDDVGTKEKPGT